MIALITGASRGIGRAIAVEFARRDVNLILNHVTSNDEITKTVEEVKAVNQHIDIKICQFDVSDKYAVKEARDKLVDSGIWPDIVVNNAGITKDKTLAKLAPEDWDSVLNVNLNGAYYVISHFLKGMLDNKWGRIINISSVIGQSGGFGQSNYSASKAGLIGLTKSLALELAKHGITANCICPGYIDTDMAAQIPSDVRKLLLTKVPLMRFGRTEEVANAAWFIVENGYITGHQLNINGGLYM